MQAPLYVTPLVALLLVAARMAGLVVTAPLFQFRHLPWPIRLLLPLVLALVITPLQLSTAVNVPTSLVGIAVAVVAEAMIGAILGLGVMIVLAGAQIAGQLISQMSGLSMAEMYSLDYDDTSPVFCQLLYLAAMAVFVTIGGHRMLVGALLDTYVAVPLGSVSVPALGSLAIKLSTESFSLGIRGAAPAITALMLSTLILGVLTRSFPPLNMLSVGLGINVAVTFVAVMISAGAIVWLFQEQFEPAIDTIVAALRDRAS